MNVYLGVLFFVVLVCLYPTKSEKGKRNKLLIALLPIYLMCGFHGEWSGDYGAYKDIYYYIKSRSFNELPLVNEHVEVGYQYFNYFLPTHFSLLLVYSFWICLFLYILFLKAIPEKYWSVAFVVTFLNQQMLMGDISAIRNGMAVGFFIIAIHFLNRGDEFQKNKIWFILFIILGGLIHTSCFFMAVFMFLSRKQASEGSLTRTIIAFVAFFIVTMMTPKSIIEAIDYFINNVVFFDRYVGYLDEEEATVAKGISRIIVFYVAIVSIIEMRKVGYTAMEYMMIRFALVWSVMMLLPGSIATRFFFYVSYVMLAGMMIMAYRTNNKLIRWGNILSLMLYYFYNFRVYSHTDWFIEHWKTYTLYF